MTVRRRVRLPSLILKGARGRARAPGRFLWRGAYCHGGGRASNTRARGFDSFTPCQVASFEGRWSKGKIPHSHCGDWGSSPHRSTRWGRSSMGRAPHRLCGRWGFESPRLHGGSRGYVAMVACGPSKPCGAGSSPATRSSLRWYFNGRTPARQAGDPGSIPGRRSLGAASAAQHRQHPSPT